MEKKQVEQSFKKEIDILKKEERKVKWETYATGPEKETERS